MSPRNDIVSFRFWDYKSDIRNKSKTPICVVDIASLMMGVIILFCLEWKIKIQLNIQYGFVKFPWSNIYCFVVSLPEPAGS